MKKLLGLLLIPSISLASGFFGGGAGSAPSIGGPITGGTQYSVIFVNPNATIAQDPTKFGYDVTNTRLCLGCDVSTATKTFSLTGTAVFNSLTTGIAHFDSSGNLTSSTIVNADVNSTAAIAFTKMAALSASVVPVTNASGFITSSSVTATTLGFLDATSSIQTQLNSKQATLTIGNLTDAGTDGLVVTGGTGSVIGSGTSLAQHVSDSTHNGYLSSTDWSNFNGKQASGNYITALTGDVTASGPGSVAATLATVNGNVGTFAVETVNAKGLVTAAANLSGDMTTSGAVSTLATVNSNVGSFGSSTSIPSFTVNGKGLVTAASGNVVIAPAGTLTGTTLAANVVSSSLTSVGTIATGIWNGTTIAIANGGTGQTSKAAAFDALSPMTTGGDVIYGGASGTGTRLANGSSGQFLKSNGGTAAPSWSTISGAYTVPTVQRFTSSSGTYTTPTSPAPIYITVEMVGGGSGGAGSTSNGGSGGNTTFSNWTAGASTSPGAQTGGPGGTNTTGTGTLLINVAGGAGASTQNSSPGAVGGNGGSSFFGGNGGGGPGATAGTAAAVNSGSGGGGAGGGASTASDPGGGAGGYLKFMVASPSATYSYGVGAAGTAGTGTFPGGAGGAGIIIVTEYYQ